MGVGSDFFDLGVCNVAAEVVIDLLQAALDVFGFALGEHFDGSIRQVADKAGELMAVGDSMCGVAKADALHLTDEDYVSGSLVHFKSFVCC